MNGGPLASVVVPTYNYGRYVEDAVDSALAQTYSPVEVIVVDDGSTDDTQDRLRRYGSRIRVIRQPNGGLSAARNTGIRAARGEYIALLDSDDAFHPRKLENQIAYLSANGWPPFLASAGILSVDRPAWPQAPVRPTARRWTIEQLVIRSRFGSCGVLVRRSCFEAVGYFDESLRSVEDRDMWIRIAAAFPILELGARLWWYRTTPGSMSRNAALMEHYERAVIEKSFALPVLRGRKSLRRKALAKALLTAAHRYFEANDLRTALKRVAQSVVGWPIPFSQSEVAAICARPRLALAVLRRMAGRVGVDRLLASIGSASTIAPKAIRAHESRRADHP